MERKEHPWAEMLTALLAAWITWEQRDGTPIREATVWYRVGQVTGWTAHRLGKVAIWAEGKYWAAVGPR